ncbi:hypothetical protein WR164_12840 [Philodulcilactobacillus myokoensis]|uniref:Uncharacterized protein n=1 Tax=Philodulcilactobacillus myokoensis TaxID=2929573 RepID=A0A9W6B1R8_9LACO|nr:hypothetical protein [Philodulcilactobacillus myokoensis]GLB47305.1 hypothetical protein WR164_12840 [Philodulcilactobacillus myokoensis]
MSTLEKTELIAVKFISTFTAVFAILGLILRSNANRPSQIMVSTIILLLIIQISIVSIHVNKWFDRSLIGLIIILNAINIFLDFSAWSVDLIAIVSSILYFGSKKMVAKHHSNGLRFY